MILAATPSPAALDAPNPRVRGSLGGDEVSALVVGFVVSVREGGGAMAAPPEVAVEKQSQLVSL